MLDVNKTYIVSGTEIAVLEKAAAENGEELKIEDCDGLRYLAKVPLHTWAIRMVDASRPPTDRRG